MIKKIKNFIRVYSTFHIPDKRKNIFLFSAPRSGSTWLLEILMTQKGYKWVREPFNLRNAHVRKHLGISHWVELQNKVSLPKIEKYIQTLASRNIRDIGYKYPAPFKEFWRPVTHGTMFKILHACEGYIEILKEKFNGEVIFLIRHPIPVALSRDVLPRLNTFIESDFRKNFKQEQLIFAANIIEKGTHFEKGILDWCFQNAVPLKHKKPDWLIVYYEDLILYPEKVIDAIAREFQFTDKEKMFSRLHIASTSSKKSKEETQKIIFDPQKLKDNKKWLLEKWVGKISGQEKLAAQEILDIFDIKVYRADDTLPQKQEYFLAK